MSSALFSRRILAGTWLRRRAVRSLVLCAGCWGALFAGLTSAAPPTIDPLNQPTTRRNLFDARIVTHGPKAHWFGRGNKDQIDVTGRYLLAMEVGSRSGSLHEHRQPTSGENVKLGMVDLEDGDRWIELGESRAWSWQQGCMLQWRPGSETEVLYNDREGDHDVCRVLDVKTRKLRTLPRAIEDVTPDGKFAVSADAAGVWSMDMETGETKPIVSIAQLAAIPCADAQPQDKLRIGRMTISPSGRRVLMLVASDRLTRLFTAALDGGDVRLLSSQGASHWTWRDDEHVLIWALGGFKLHKDDGTGEPKETLWTAPEGHPTYIPGTNGQWLVADTCPQGHRREQIVYLFHRPTRRAFILKKFPLPKGYDGAWLCPRVSRDGKTVTVDLPPGGKGRQIYMVNISRIVAGEGLGFDTFTESHHVNPSDVITNDRPIPPPQPRNPEVQRQYDALQSRVAEIRKRYEPYLRSLPKPLDLRKRAALDSDWRTKFEVEHATDAARPEPPDWYRENLDDSAWEKTTVPEWRYKAHGFRETVSCIFWYRKQFSAPRPAAGRRTFLVFDGVDWEAEVWLNGKRLGSHVGNFEPFRFDVTDLLKEDGSKNTLAVRIFQGPHFGEPSSYNGLFSMPPAKVQRYVPDEAQSILGYRHNDMLLGGGFGIHRGVRLETMGDTRIDAVFARAKPETQQATVTVETDTAAAKQAILEVQLLPENFEGRSYTARVACDLPRGQGKQTLTVPMPQSKTWSPETPYLYRCRVICRNNVPSGSSEGQMIDSHDVLIGSRSLELVSKQWPREGLSEGLLLLNGKPLFIRGTNIQGFNALPFWGRNDRLMDVALLLKAADFNTVRSCQHVVFPEIRELFDRLGILSEQDQGSGREPLNLAQLPHTGTLLARVCYNNPGVILLSFGNETHFDPTKIIEAVLAVDPERIIIPISGNHNREHVQLSIPKDKPIYPIPDEYWANVIHDYHSYLGWYFYCGQVWKMLESFEPQRLVIAGEYGGEALDSYETMTQHYPLHWEEVPPATADVLWGSVQVYKADRRQLVGSRGKQPVNLGEYIEASQTYQADVVAERSKGYRLSPRTIGGYFQFHFYDVTAANWPKAVVSHDLMPKKAYYAMAQVNQPLVPLFQVLGRGEAMTLWVANDTTDAIPGCRVRWAVQSGGKMLLDGEQAVDVPAVNAVVAGKADLSKLPADADVVTIHLTLSDAAGKSLATYEQEVFLRAWREQEALLELSKEKFKETL